jgi:hypothetical protein
MTFDEQVQARFLHDPVFRSRVKGAEAVLRGSLTLHALAGEVIAAVVHAHDCALRPPVDEIERLGARLRFLHRAQSVRSIPPAAEATGADGDGFFQAPPGVDNA